MQLLPVMPRDQRADWRRVVSFMLVLVAHLALIGAALRWTSREPNQRTVAALEARAMELTLVPVAPPALPTNVSPGPLLREQIDLEAKMDPLPQPKLELPPDLDSLADLYTPPKRETSPSNTSAAEQATAPPSVNVTTDTSYAAQQDSAGSSSEALATWQSMLLAHLQRFKRYPRRAERQRQQGVVYVLFSVDRQGNVHDGRLGKSSGYPALDEETLAVLQRASPVPPPPPQIVGDPVEVMVPVSFYLGSG